MRCAVTLSLLAFPSLAGAVTVSVSPGDPVATLTSALGPGDTVIFTDGTYILDEGLRWSGTGSQDQPITLKAQNAGQAVLQMSTGGVIVDIADGTWILVQDLIFEGAANWMDESYGGIRISSNDGFISSNIIIQDCEVRNVMGSGIRVDGDSSSLTIERNHVHDTGDGSGISIGTSDAGYWMQDSVVAENHIHNIGGEYSRGIYLANGSQGNVVRDNVIHGIPYHGLFVGSTESGDSNEVTGNIVWQAVDTGMWFEGAAIIQNNIVFDVDGDGIRSWNDDNRNGLENQVISHNTVVNTTGDAIQLSGWFFRSGMVFTNNVAANPTGYGLDYDDDSFTEYDSTSNYIRSNVVTGLVEGYDKTIFPDWVIAGAGFSDFVDVENWDFYPSSSATIINVGDGSSEAWVPQFDFNGAPRDGAAPDAGAYEWDGEGNPGWTVQEGFKQLGYDNAGATHDVGAGGCCGGKNAEKKSEKALFFLPFLTFGWLFRRRR